MRFKLIPMLALMLAICILLYMTLGAKGSWSFILPFRGGKLVALLVVAVSVSSATVLFQTVSGNRILTPSIMGFDALYMLILTGMVFFLGAQSTLRLPQEGVFVLNAGMMMIASLALFGTLINQDRGDILRMILTGLIFATLFRSLTTFAQRVIDPNEYQVIQVSSFARFNQLEFELLPPTAVLTVAVLIQVWRMRRRLDVLALGFETATNLGLSVRRETFLTLILISVLVSASTALVGPVVFLGLLVVSIARIIDGTETHSRLLLTSALLSAITLVGGQMLMERVFQLSTPLSVVIDFAGGFVFLWLLLKRQHQ